MSALEDEAAREWADTVDINDPTPSGAGLVWEDLRPDEQDYIEREDRKTMTEEELQEQQAAQAAVACRRCHVEAGEGCHDSSGNPLPSYEGGPLIHTARLADYRATL